MTNEFSPALAKSLSDYFAQRSESVLGVARALVEIESPSGDREGSRAVVEMLTGDARSIDGVTKVERIAAVDDYGEHFCLTAFADAVPDQQNILLIGHTDTVYPRGTLDERPWRVESGRAYGPGVFDMKANCALALEVLRACDAVGIRPNRPVVLLLTCDEEVGSMCGGRLLVEKEARRAAAALVLEPPGSGGRVKTERKGTAGYTITTRGRAAHAGLEPEKGVSAILEMARQIERLHGLNDPSRGTTVNVGVVSGGTRSNVVAAEARAEVDVRFTTMDEARRIEKVFEDLHPFDDRVRLTVEGDVNRPPLERGAAVISLYEHARRIAAALDFELGEISVGGASDGNFVAAVGAPVLDGLGIEGDGAHADHEHIIVKDIARRGALLAGLIATL